jgi:signal transduction histidine kinase
MTPPTQLATVGLAAVAVAVLALVAARHGPFPAPAEEVVLDVFAGCAAVVAGVLVGRWRAGNPNAWLLVAAGAVVLGGVLEWSNVAVLFTLGGVLGGVEYAVIAHLLVALPDGRLTRPADRRLVALGYLVAAATSVVPNLFFECRGAFAVGCPGNLLLVRDDPAAMARSETWLGLAGLAVVALIATYLGRRWLAAGVAGRRVLTTPYVAAVPLASVALLDVSAVWDRHGQLAGFVRPLTLAVLPVAILLGVLRARGRAGDLGELVVAAGPDPTAGVRDRLGHAIAQALGDPSARLLRTDTVRASSAGGLAAAPDADRADDDGEPAARPRVRTPIAADGQRLAILEHDAALEAEPEVLSAVLATAALALHNQRLAEQVQAQLEEVRASRSRLAAAQDEERRRIERDLHDGAQQLLVSVQLLLRMALDHGADPQLLADAAAQLDAAVSELRALARGVHPHLVTQRGLRAAVETLAERAPVPVTVEGDLPRLPALSETTAYFVVAEAMTNVARHAHASHVLVRLGVTDGRAELEVEDDGAGGVRLDGAGHGGGSGLLGLRDRVEAAGGTLWVGAGDGGRGTRLRVALPTGPSEDVVGVPGGRSGGQAAPVPTRGRALETPT